MNTAEVSWPSPDPRDELGLVALDYNLSVERLQSAYRHGIFPWPDSGLFSPIPWVCPPKRAVLDFAHLHVPKSVRKSQRRLGSKHFTIDRAFPAVIQACANAPRPGQSGTWITPPMIAAYTDLHQRGQAHSIELWDGEILVAGLYGVTAGGVFTGESMFHRIDDGSKLCVLFLIEHLKQRGATWIDVQQLTPHFALLGAGEIRREEFLRRLRADQQANLALF